MLKNNWERLWRFYIKESQGLSLSTISPGIPLDGGKLDYSHVLPAPERQSGYKLILTISKPTLKGRLYNPAGKNIGVIEGTVSKTGMQVEDVIITDSDEKGKGFGVAMYEALYAHAFNAMGIKRIIGVEHSTSAARVHNSLAKKYGFSYSADTSRDITGDIKYDRAYGSYGYKLH